MEDLTFKVVQTEEQLRDAIAIDETVMGAAARGDYLTGLMHAGIIIVAYEGDVPTGYAASDPASFFYRPYLALVVVDPAFRRQGIGSALVQAMEHGLNVPRLFTSTNLSNDAMVILLNKSGYKQCGQIMGLDEGDPEWVFSKDFQRT